MAWLCAWLLLNAAVVAIRFLVTSEWFGDQDRSTRAKTDVFSAGDGHRHLKLARW